MSCNDKLNQRCKKVYASCVAYESTVPDFSGLVSDECINIQEVAEDVYDILTEIKEDINISGLDNECLTLPNPLTIPSLFQLLITTICEMQTLQTEQTGLIETLQEQVALLQEGTCP